MSSNKTTGEDSAHLHLKVPTSLKEELREYCDKRLINMSIQVRIWINDILNGKEVSINDDDTRSNKRAS
jgi:hypothetical protein